jgi:copper oxidase (laccase) domain-containing protein
MKDYRAFVREFRGRSTDTLIKNYHKYNSDFKRIARQELKNRGVSSNKMPFKKRVVRSTSYGRKDRRYDFDFGLSF